MGIMDFFCISFDTQFPWIIAGSSNLLNNNIPCFTLTYDELYGKPNYSLINIKRTALYQYNNYIFVYINYIFLIIHVRVLIKL
jgi:hypothetical protein